MEKNSCQYTDKDIWNYYSNLLSRNEEAEMQEHILSCSNCKKRLNHLRNIANSLDEEPDTDSLILEQEKPQNRYTIKHYLIVATSIAASITLLLWIVVTKNGEKDNEHPIYNIDSPSYSAGDTLSIDSVDTELDLDTLLIR